jgi:hypothetical protein
MPALRLLPTPPPVASVPGQLCFSFVPILVVVAWDPAPRRQACKAKRRRALQLRLDDYIPWAKRPIRSKALKPYAPRTQRTGPRRRSMGLTALPPEEFWQLQDDERELEEGGILATRPRMGNGIDGDCEEGPCPWVSCRHHLYLDVDETTGALKLNFPGKEVWELEETCSLRVAAQIRIVETEEETREETGLGLERVGELTNVTLEWARRIQDGAAKKMKRRLERLRRPSG